MVGLDTLANYAEVFGAIAVTGGLLFAVIQIRQLKRQRRDQAAIELVQAFQSQEFLHALRRVLDLPEGITAEGVRSRGKDVEDDVRTVGSVIETMGVMVYHQVAPLEVVNDLSGGVILAAWKRVGPYIHLRREELGFAKFDEWFQWLAERIEEYQESTSSAGAYEAHRHWRPR